MSNCPCLKLLYCATAGIMFSMYFAIYVQESICIAIYFCHEYCQVMELLRNKEQRLAVEAQFHKVMEECRPSLLKIIDKSGASF